VGDLGMYIAASGLDAARTAMDAVAENLANADTASYVRERVNLAASPSLDINGVGSGVEVASISQVANAVLAATALAGQSSLAYASTSQQIAQSIQGIFPEPNGSSGISTQLSNFWNSWDQIAADPTALAPRTEVVAQAQSLATSLNLAATDLSQLAVSTTSQLQQVVNQVNTYDTQVAQLNSQIIQAKATGADANSLIDQRNQIITDLGKYIGVTSRESQNGSVSLSVGGVMLVQDTSVTQLALNTASGVTSVVAKNAGVALPVTSGSAAAYLKALNTTIPTYQSYLDGVANDLANTVNNQLSQGVAWYPAITGAVDPSTSSTTGGSLSVSFDGNTYNYSISAWSSITQLEQNIATASGGQLTATTNSSGQLVIDATNPEQASTLEITGGSVLAALGLTQAVPASAVQTQLPAPNQPMFEVSTSTTPGAAASSISVNPAVVNNPYLIAAASPGGGPSDGSNAQAMANLYNSSNGPDQAYATMIGELGAYVQTVNEQAQAATSLSTSATAVNQAVSGVNIDQEMVDMLNYQQAYQASAKVISTVNTMITSLMQAV